MIPMKMRRRKKRKPELVVPMKMRRRRDKIGATGTKGGNKTVGGIRMRGWMHCSAR
jgi:hypothetical protein